ncbi:MAG: hypothetical protein A3J73_06500 [Planctomycetes bacterium RIFCSPHIGHO2_02_FULL_38_41]|nr:MAG: hypothetical protein A3J73_06500 [Planctomycetes bacterium RIFCSPHIGHO2_02_FULL_38_41]
MVIKKLSARYKRGKITTRHQSDYSSFLLQNFFKKYLYKYKRTRNIYQEKLEINIRLIRLAVIDFVKNSSCY